MRNILLQCENVKGDCNHSGRNKKPGAALNKISGEHPALTAYSRDDLFRVSRSLLWLFDQYAVNPDLDSAVLFPGFGGRVVNQLAGLAVPLGGQPGFVDAVLVD